MKKSGCCAVGATARYFRGLLHDRWWKISERRITVLFTGGRHGIEDCGDRGRGREREKIEEDLSEV